MIPLLSKKDSRRIQQPPPSLDPISPIYSHGPLLTAGLPRPRHPLCSTPSGWRSSFTPDLGRCPRLVCLALSGHFQRCCRTAALQRALRRQRRKTIRRQGPAAPSAVSAKCSLAALAPPLTHHTYSVTRSPHTYSIFPCALRHCFSVPGHSPVPGHSRPLPCKGRTYQPGATPREQHKQAV